jgi:hypothetical protein
MSNKKKRIYVHHNMTPIGIFMWLSGCTRLHADGDIATFVCRWWHPLTWLLMAALLIPCALMGKKLLSVVPLCLSPFWRKNRDQLQWVTPWTRLDRIKPFNHSHSKSRPSFGRSSTPLV